MEFTGMVDQKGNDIYEGDILDLPKHKLGRHGELPNGRGIVTQDNASFYCHPTNAEAGDVGHWTNPLTFWSTTQGISLGKIIGNIFQNKNLIDRYKLETTKTFLLSKLSKN